MSHGSDREKFIEKVTDLTKRLKCQGNVPGKEPLPEVIEALNLDVILRLGIMMQDPEEVRLALKLGADLESKIKNTTALELAYVYGNKKIIKLIKDWMPTITPEATKKNKIKPNPGSRGA